MRRIGILLGLALAAAPALKGAEGSPAGPATAAPPNIVVIFSDDHALQAIGAYGSVINKTPQIDRLASLGATFRRSFCDNSLCAPSRASVLTGKLAHKHGMMSNVRDTFDNTQPTLPKHLRAAGYQTAVIGKWHLKSDPTGFDHWEILPGQGCYYNPDFESAAGKRRIEGYVTDVVTDLSLEWLERRDKSKPFLLLSWHKAPHRNWAPAARHLDRYRGADLPEPPTLFDDHAGRHPSLAATKMTIDRHFYWDYDLKLPGMPETLDPPLDNFEYARMTPAQKAAWDAAYRAENEAFRKNPPTGKDLVRWKYQRYVKDYVRCIDALDENVGRVLDYLKEKGLLDSTIVIYGSDQGFYVGEHGWYDKRWMFEESMRMPLIVHWPGVTKPGSVVDRLVQNIDWAPTLLGAAGVPVPADMQGEDFRPILADPAAPWRTSLYYHYFEHGGEHNVPEQEGVRTERHKLIRFPRDGGVNVFDLEKDPREMTSVHADPAYADVRAGLEAELVRLRKKYDVPER